MIPPLSYSVHQELLYKLMRVSSDTSRRTTVVGLHHKRCGSSVSVTPATLLPWASCALCQIVQHRLCCLSFNSMSAVVQCSTAMNGQHTGEYSSCSQSVRTTPSITLYTFLTRLQEFTPKTSSPVALV